MDQSLKPALKFPGGKRWLVPRLRSMYVPHRNQRLVEPFVGGMAVALGLRPETALLSDVNLYLINFYLHLQAGFVSGLDMRNDETLYYQHREEFNRWTSYVAKYETSPHMAELFYYLNRTGFNGLCRFNRKGQFNVPFGKYKTINYRRDFSAYKTLLSKWQIGCVDFAGLTLVPDDFLYLDPPYDTPFTSYSAGGFSWDDQQRLVAWAVLHPGPVVASNQATERIVDLYRGHGFKIELLDAPRRISCKGDRTPAKEMLATRNVIERQIELFT